MLIRLNWGDYLGGNFGGAKRKLGRKSGEIGGCSWREER